MSISTSRLLAFLSIITLTLAQSQDTGGDVPLYTKKFTWPNLPQQADTGNGPRGTQQGYNRCNSTTQNQNSMCQTSFLNSINEFCLWGAPQPNTVVGDVEGEMVAYCTTKKFGTRLIQGGALQGVQLIRTPGYIEVIGFIDQTALNLQANDTGGEEDPHGADQRGNPLGGLMYSDAFNTPGGPAYTQVIEWSYFIGSGIFCYKACDPAGPNAAQLCQHVYDRIGCRYNAPANYPAINGTFQSCKGDNQLPAGIYVDGPTTKTFVQPPESLGPIATIPYTPVIPATSECTTYTSAALYTDLPAPPINTATLAVPTGTSKPSDTNNGNSMPAATGTSGRNAASSDASSLELHGVFMALSAVVAIGFGISLV
ncbi:uncharacterized protein MELLADRAFT_73714 [Melampsora larici-populina 98AG31]|uniref:Secreted protein n=1 Tax=Melampsora larici-populina (strain 98AG31 / pathotype 3-4-7) TaxID=747676 RepID=F4SCG9_MELLP|nr:uncharacterized protein MELLADRAFT_73714 [Melampsora larici-populina 98AG31]EGF97652.1 hypothetical protein MELLADRAFT_73714 [Melampsora larici-populina 98AG31]